MQPVPDRCHQIDEGVFRTRRAELLATEVVELRDALIEAGGVGGLRMVCSALMPRVRGLADGFGEEGDSGDVFEDSDEFGDDGDDVLMVDATASMTVLAGRLILWWLYAIDAPVGVGVWWWRAHSLLEAADDLDVSNVADREVLLRLEAHLAVLLDRLHVHAIGGAAGLRAELAVLSEFDLTSVFVETAEDAAALVVSLGGSVLLEALVQ